MQTGLRVLTGSILAVVVLAMPANALITGQYFQYAAEDATVDSDSPTANFGQEDILDIQGTSGGMMAFDSIRQSFLKFDLSEIPDDATIVSAVFGIYLSDKGAGVFNGVDPHASVYFVTDDAWTEGDITYNTKPAAQAGHIDEKVLMADEGYYEWDLLSAAGESSWKWAFAGDLEDDALSLMLMAVDEDLNNFAEFFSSEAGQVALLPPGISDVQPYLEVQYEYVPEPMTIGLLGVGALFLRRRR